MIQRGLRLDHLHDLVAFIRRPLQVATCRRSSLPVPSKVSPVSCRLHQLHPRCCPRRKSPCSRCARASSTRRTAASQRPSWTSCNASFASTTASGSAPRPGATRRSGPRRRGAYTDSRSTSCATGASVSCWTGWSTRSTACQSYTLRISTRRIIASRICRTIDINRLSFCLETERRGGWLRDKLLAVRLDTKWWNVLKELKFCLNGWFIKRKSIGRCAICTLDHLKMVNV